MLKLTYKEYPMFVYWKKHKFKIIVLISIITIILMYFYNDRKKGTWSLEYSYNPVTKRTKFVKESKGEKECRRVMEKIFERPFPNHRPLFLTNVVTGKPLEIDCCNLDLKLGVEYDGIGHAQYTPGMHKNFEAFRIQQYRDEMKNKLCKENGFTLIRVPHTIPIESIENYLIEELRINGYKI
jgi:hypothetical protein